MRALCGAWKVRMVAAGCLILALQMGRAQSRAGALTPQTARTLLVDQAHQLEARGRPDMAVQLWQQILLSDPKNQEAMEGIARDYKLIGAAQKASDALARLRSAYPNDPNIPKIEALASTRVESDQLRHAGELARSGKNADAMRVYRQLYGDHPPDGDIALAYYQTLYGTPGGKPEAIAAMRALAARNPGDPRYAIELGTMLTYNQDSRGEGIRLLEEHRSDPTADAALRQALIWTVPNPAFTPDLESYLREHPQDAEIAKLLGEDRAELAKGGTGIARTPAEIEAFSALREHKLEDAEARFNAILAREPNNGRAAAGMGFLRMQQKNFGAAIAYLNQAEQDGLKDRTVEDALQTSRFWYTMGEASQAFDANHFDVAEAKYRQALVMKPGSPDALSGLAGLYMKDKQYANAADVYQALLRVQPEGADSWRGLFLAYAQDKQYDKALGVQAHFPTAVKTALERDPEYLSQLAAIYQAEGRSADAQRVLALALALPFPKNGAGLKVDTRLQYAGLLMAAQRYDQAAGLYEQILDAQPDNLSAWLGLISAHHSLGQDTQAMAEVQRMPSAAYQAALNDADFLALLGSIYQQANQLEVAQGLLERAARVQLASGAEPALTLQLQLAAIYLQRNDATRAYALYREILTRHPNRPEGWMGLISTLLATHREQQALEEMALIPPAVRKELDADVDFMQAEASAYAATGDISHAAKYMNAVNDYYARLKEEPPPNVAVQTAWLLYNTHSDSALYQALMGLGARRDLTVVQRETVEEIWADWSVRRASEAMNNQDPENALEILDAALQAFPNNLTVRRAVAGGYAQVGRAKEALILFKTIPMQNATAADYEGAIGAAMAANDLPQAESWLRDALARYANDSGILALAARYEQARGDDQRAAAYWRASLAAMPQPSATDRLAHELVYPEEDTRAHRAATAADLQRLLNPDNQPFARTTKLPPLPAYGPDPYQGAAPVVLQPAESQPQSQPEAAPATSAPANGPPTSDLEPPPAHDLQAQPAAPQHTAMTVEPATPLRPSTGRAAGYTIAVLRAQHSGAPLRPAVYDPDANEAHLLRVAAAPQTAAAQAESPDNGVGLSAHAPHSLASDAWKGLILSLLAQGHDAQAIAEIGKIPPDIRSILDADLDFVQSEASLYLAVHDTPRAVKYLNEIESYYAAQGGAPPAGLEIQHALILFQAQDDGKLYPLLTRLDARKDLTASDRKQIDDLWAEWAVRRADAAMSAGDAARGVELLDAASTDYPNSLTVRTAVAGAYARLGRAADAVALFKTIPPGSLGPADLAAAISAAVAAPDLTQAHIWLDAALVRYHGNPSILEAAARYEQARGDNTRATEYWRAAIAAMPPGSAPAPSAEINPGSAGNETAMWPAMPPGETKRLLAASMGEETTLPPPSAPAAPHPAGGVQPAAEPPAPNPKPAGQPTPLEQSSVQSAAPAVGVDQGTPLGCGTASTGGCAPAVAGSAAPNPTTKHSAAAAAPSIPLPAANQESAEEAHALAVLQALRRPAQSDAVNVETVPAPAEQSIPAAPGPTAAPPVLLLAQYTPSAQEAATGAYSSPKSQSAQPKQTPAAGEPAPASPRKERHRRGRKKNAPAETLPAPPASAAPASQPAAPTLGSVPAAPPTPQAPQIPEQVPSQTPANTDTGLSNQELEQRNLPPLTGPWVRVQRQQRPLSPRDEAERQLQAIQSSYSGWLGGTGVVNYRSGNLGYDHLSALVAPFEASVPIGYNARFTVVARPVFLDSGQAAGNAVISVDESTTAGTTLTTIPEPLGTDTNTAGTTTTGVGVPPQQNATGVGGEAQLIFPHFALAGGYTPSGFLVATFTARGYWRPANGPITFTFNRDSVTDSQLSYSGLRDPEGATLGTLGTIWGGVVANYATVQLSRGSAQSGFYVGAGGQYLSGYNVETNTRIEGSGGAYWHVYTVPEYGDLSIGANFFGMHYANNQDAFTFGMGGYFSPQAYFLANIPFTWVGHYQTHWHYNILGGIGVQAFQEDETPLWPLAAQKSLETGNNNPMLPALTSVGPNYDLRSQAAYEISPHWFAGGFFSANNTRNYSSVSAGFYVRYMFRNQPAAITAPTGIFPTDGLRPFRVP